MGCFIEVCRRGGLKVNADERKVMQIERFGVLHEGFLVPVLLYGSETIILKEKERSWFRVVQMDSLRGLLGIRRMDRVPNEWIRVM